METQTAFDPASALWADVEPVYQEESASPLCPILYDPKYSKAMDLYRAFILKPEYSTRTLALTTHLIRCNPSNYSLWAFRARILLQDKLDISSDPKDPFLPELSPTLEGRIADELDFLDVLAKENMKNYQVWQHRKVIITELSKLINQRAANVAAEPAQKEWKQVAAREMAFVRDALKQDAKNYHTWAYRQWALGYFGGVPRGSGPSQDQAQGSGSSVDAIRQATGEDIWAGELPYIEELLEDDLRNNSAWSHRYFTLFASWAPRGNGEVEIISAEVQYTIGKLGIAKNNSSAWGYLRGIMRRLKEQDEEAAYQQERQRVDTFASSLNAPNDEAAANPEIDASNQAVPLALEWLLDSHIERGEVEQASIYADRLTRADPMRARYWQYRKQSLL